MKRAERPASFAQMGEFQQVQRGPVAAERYGCGNGSKKIIEGLKAANEAFKVQEKAEKALQKAAGNNHAYLQGKRPEVKRDCKRSAKI